MQQTEATQDILLARQPIFDRNLCTIAYELLFRPNSHEQPGEWDGDRATTVVMLNAFSEIGIKEVVGPHRAFVNYTRNLVLNPPPFPPEEVVVEILEDISPDDELLKGVSHLKALGYTIALDDFEYSDAFKPLIELADIIKIDVLALSQATLEEHIEILKPYKIKLLAEKVEDQEMYDNCKSLGFDYFQGFFLSRPKIVKGKAIPANKLVVMKLLAELQLPEIDPQQLHDTISKDPALSFKLLKLINSAAFRTANKIDSLYRAILLIGPKQIKQWASLLALSKLDEKPHALREQTMMRAKLCELLGSKINKDMTDLFFTVGMLSMLEAFFDAPLETLLDSLSLNDEIATALQQHQGPAGFVLATATAYEEGRWGDISWVGLQQYGLSLRDVKNAYLESVSWSDNTGEALTL